MANRVFIELIEGKNKNGTTKKKKYFAKSDFSLRDSMQAFRLADKFKKVEEKQQEDENYIPLEEMDEAEYFIVEAFEKQFTVEQLENGLPAFPEGFEYIMNILGSIASPSDGNDTKAFLEEKKN